MIQKLNLGLEITTNKTYFIPFGKIYEYPLQDDEFLLNISVKELKEMFQHNPPDNFIKYIIKKVSLYDSSSNVNSFIYKGKNYWFDKTTRASLMNAINASNDQFTFVLGDDEVVMSKDSAKNFVQMLELYAQQTYVVTQRHLRYLNSFSSPRNGEEFSNQIKELINYDFTSGYPEKIEIK